MVKEVLLLTVGVLVPFKEKNEDRLELKLIIFVWNGWNVDMYHCNC